MRILLCRMATATTNGPNDWQGPKLAWLTAAAGPVMQVLRQLRTSVSSGSHPLSEAEMDRHTLRGLREVCPAALLFPCIVYRFASLWWSSSILRGVVKMQKPTVVLSTNHRWHGPRVNPEICCRALQDAAADGREAKSLVYVRPEDNMAVVVERLFDNRCSMAPILSGDPNGAALSSCSSFAPAPVHQPDCHRQGCPTDALRAEGSSAEQRLYPRARHGICTC